MKISVKFQALSLAKKMKLDKRRTLATLDQLQPELGNLALFGLEQSDGDLRYCTVLY